jgi:hypothetical protein
MNKKGIVLSGLIYVLLTFFILLLVSFLAVLWYRQNAMDALRKDADAIYDDIYISEYSKEFAYTGDAQTFIVPIDGTYKIELWGASGDNFNNILGGRGGYTTGQIFLKKDTTLYIYVGGTTTNETGGYNGGGSLTPGQYAFGRAGGGATDVRITSGAWNDTTSLRSRIMVAGGGGGANNRNAILDCGYGEGVGGAGGGLVGSDGQTINHTYNGCTYGWAIGLGGTQTSGGFYISYNSSGVETARTITGSFGKGGGVEVMFTQSGGGSGYYGGGLSGHGGAGGGSSFISGYSGCNAIDANGNHTGGPNHYSGYIFNNAKMIAGNDSMPLPNGGIETGHTGNGYAKITYLP